MTEHVKTDWEDQDREWGNSEGVLRWKGEKKILHSQIDKLQVSVFISKIQNDDSPGRNLMAT